MYRIMRNCWIDEVRSRQRRSETFAPEEAGLGVGDDGDRHVEARVELAAVDRAMAALPVEQREVIALVLVEGLAYREAADILGVPMGTLTSRLVRGRQALMAQLGEGA
jgi:RNA polymerase sigma-70 factor (ECF subfamily)